MRHVELRPGIYRDSVALMRISARLADSPGVARALVAMATPINVELAGSMGFDPPVAAVPNDLLVALEADDDALAEALTSLESALHAPEPGARPSTEELTVQPRTTATAARVQPAALALVSTPGPHAFVEAMDALDAGLSVMVFSDNVPLTQEVRLKEHAASLGLLVMGPDCGTALVGGVGLGFANAVRPGTVGIVAASGTGAQQVLALLAAAGVGISHCLGVGGRDLSDVVGGRSTLAALDMLDADPETSLILVIGKPAAPEVAARVRTHAAGLATPTVVAPLGGDSPDLTAIVEQVLTRLAVPVPTWPSWGSAAPPRMGLVHGLFAGGTLCAEAQGLLDSGPGEGHVLLDLGDDRYTLGRPHPMLDPAARLPHLARSAGDPDVSAILLDVVLGHGSHPDPASVLAPAFDGLRPSIVVSLVGTPDDPQDLARQAATLSGAGARVFLSNAQAVRFAAGGMS